MAALAKLPLLLGICALLTGVSSAAASAQSIHDLAASGNVERVLALLSTDPALIAARDANARTPLHLATRGGHLAMVEALVGAGADVNAADKDGTPPLHSAAFRGHETILRFLLAHGASPDARDKRGNTALVYALNASRRANVMRLLIFGWNADVEGAHHRFTGRQEARQIDGLEVRQVSDGESSAFLVRVDGVTIFHGGDYLGGDDRVQALTWLREGTGGADLAFVDAEALAPRFPDIQFLVALDRGDQFDCSRRSR